jgi:hypothetical protein
MEIFQQPTLVNEVQMRSKLMMRRATGEINYTVISKTRLCAPDLYSQVGGMALSVLRLWKNCARLCVAGGRPAEYAHTQLLPKPIRVGEQRGCFIKAHGLLPKWRGRSKYTRRERVENNVFKTYRF